MVDISIVTMVYKPTFTSLGGHHLVTHIALHGSRWPRNANSMPADWKLPEWIKPDAHICTLAGRGALRAQNKGV